MKTYNWTIFSTSTLLASLATTSEVKVDSLEDKPNIVIIYADDMGYGDMSCQNPESKIKTPNIDRLATDGIRFTDGHSSCGVSSPSRYALLTGNYHWRRMKSIVGPFGTSVFKENEFTMPRLLKKAGYQTAMVGKWHLGWDWDSVLTPEALKRFGQGTKKRNYKLEDFDWSRPFKGGPVSIGFDYYYGDGTINFPPYCWIENEKVVTPPSFYVKELGFEPLEGAGELRPGPASTDWHPTKVLPTLTEKALDVIDKQSKDQPFFLYFALNAPHAPIIPSPEYHGKSEAGYYGDFVVQCDDIVGRVVEALEKKGLSDNTIVIFSADNGAEKYAFDRIKDFDHNSTQSLHGLKRDLWEGGHRVPFIVKWPKEIERGQVSDKLVSQVDIFATFAEIVGVDIPQEASVDSYSILPTLKGEASSKEKREIIVHNTKDGVYALRDGKWLLIDNRTGTHSEAPQYYLDMIGYKEFDANERKYLLFDLEADRLQTKDLSEKYPEKAKEMKEALRGYVSSKRSAPIMIR